jgi:HD-like signal output (HDOD) protein
MPAADAVRLMVAVLDALSLAHRHGIVHRDLKPSNVLIDAAGRPRVMDFGIAARASRPAGDGPIAGTPGYMSPEAARGEVPRPAMDVFAAGVMLAELIAGRRFFAGGDARDWIAHVQREPLRLPAQPAVDDALRAIVDRALSRDAAQRFVDAQAMHDALKTWLQPAVAASASAGHGTLEFLLRRMRHRSDFPALSDAVRRILRVTGSETESLASLCDEVLKDVALTNKILRLVNTAHYAGSGGVGTISRAVQLVGFAGIRNIATSLLLLEHLHDRGQAGLLQQEFLRALMAGTVAAELAAGAAEREQVFLGAMFQGLGRLLTEYYLPEEGREIRQRLPAASADADRDRQRVSAEVLGLSFEDLGVGVARSWGLPESLQRCMRRPVGDAPRRAADGEARSRWLATAANVLTDALLDADADDAEARLDAAASRLCAVVGQPLDAVLQAVRRARERMREAVQALEIGADAGAPVRRLIAAPAGSAVQADALGAIEPTVVCTVAGTAGGAAGAAPPAAGAADRLAAGLQDVTLAMSAGDFQLHQVLHMVLETIWRALSLQRVVFCVRDARAAVLTGRFGLGADAAALAARFRIALDGAAPDLFAAACMQGTDALISDANDARIASRLPDWYRRHVAAPTFLLLPMKLRDRPVALIYGDQASPAGIGIDAAALAMLRTLRNQALMALRQRG